MSYFYQQLKQEIITQAANLLGVEEAQLQLEPANPKFGADLALPLFRAAKGQNPTALAEQLAGQLTHDAVEKLEAAGGYVNFWLKPAVIAQGVLADITAGDYGNNQELAGREAVVEFTDPNAFKPVHIGHAYSNTVGEAIARLFEASGARVHRVTYGGDVGLHAAKAVWGIQRLEQEESMDFTQLPPSDRASFMGRAYARGGKAYEHDEAAKAEIRALNKAIYERTDDELNKLHALGVEWSYDYFEEIYARLGVKFERHYKESETLDLARQAVEEGLARGVLEKSDGAVVFKGESAGLHTRVFVNREGFLTYEAKDLGLQYLKDQEYHYDQSVILTANEQTEYFKVMLAVAEQLQPELARKTTHLSHGVVRLSSGKMSSRTGDVVTAESLLDQIEAALQERNPDGTAISENTLGAYKYAMLKQAVGPDITYDVHESIDLTGNSGPYVQYAAVRVASILEKISSNDSERGEYDWQAERPLVMLALQYPEIVATARRTYEPHLVCNFAYALARELNRYYEHVPVKDALPVARAARLEWLRAMRHLFEHSLGVLNIPVPEKM